MSDVCKLKCNWQARPTLDWQELTDRERKEFDYHDTKDAQLGARFFRYKGCTYDMGEFMRITPAIAPHPQRPKWEKFDGYASDSYFSGILIRYVDGAGFDEQVICATYYC